MVFKKATGEAAWSEMYARLCRKVMEQISSEVQDEKVPRMRRASPSLVVFCSTNTFFFAVKTISSVDGHRRKLLLPP